MAVTSQAGSFSFGPQSAKEVPATSFYRHKATLIDLGVLDDIRVGPLEIGSGPFPTFPYKAGYIVGGGVEMQPRLEDSLGWLLFATLGDVSTSGSGPYSHAFKPLAADESFVRWLTLRKYMPKKEGLSDTDLGEEFLDCKPVALTLTLPNDAPVTARWDFMGRSFSMVPEIGAVVSRTNVSLARVSNVVTVTTTIAHGFNPGDRVVVAGVTPTSFNGSHRITAVPSPTTFRFAQTAADDTDSVPGTSAVGAAWTEADYEVWGSIPVGCELGGFIKFTGGGLTAEELPVVGARVSFANQNLDIRQEKVYGSPFLEDITIIQRAITFDVTIKWNNPKLYRAILTGSTIGLDWASRPLTGELDIAAVATDNIGATGEKYELDILAPEIMWQMNGPIQLAGGQAILMRFTGTALEPTAGAYATFTLKNGVAAYAWPV